MADSKFLPFQDANGDNLPDVCPEVEPAQDVCLKCSPNPLATIPDWKRRTQKTPFLNEKLCKYQVTYNTPATTLLEGVTQAELSEADLSKKATEKLQALYEKYSMPWVDKHGKERQGAITRILVVTNKEVSEETIQIVSENLEYTDYYLDPRPNTYLKLLYSVDFDVIDELPDAVEEEEPAEPGDITVKYDINDFVVKSIRVRKGLNLYNRYYKVFRVLEGANLIYADNGKLFDLSLYGDDALFNTDALLASCVGQLDSWLNVKGYNIPNVGGMSFFKDRITEIEFTFSGEYKIKKLKIWTADCGEYPRSWSGGALEDLRHKAAWRDRTAVAYLAQIDEIESAMSARVERPWKEVITEFTYPQVVSTLGSARDVEEEKTFTGCIADALENEMKTLGQDILDDVFSIGDAVAYAFHKNLCRHDPTEVTADNVKIGKVFGIPETDDGSDIWASDIMQAYKEIDPRDQVFAHFCMYFLMGPGIAEGCPPMGAPGSPMQMLDSLWSTSLDRIALCGLIDLMGAVVDCLLGGMTLEEALNKMLMSALKAMAWDDFSELFVGLDPDKQEELDQLVQKKLKEGVISVKSREESFTDDSAVRKVQKGEEGKDIKLFAGWPWEDGNFIRPFENEELIAQQKESLRYNNGNAVPTKAPGYAAGPSPTRRTLSQKFAIADNEEAMGGLDPNLVMDAYIMALLELFQDDLLSLLDIMNKFPGAQIVALLISTMECPRPPLFNPGVLDFIKSLSFPFCSTGQPIVLPRLENPLIWIPKFKDIYGAIIEMLKRLLMQLILKIIVRILVKICELLGDAICKALEMTGNIVGSLPSIISGRNTFTDVIRETVCGPDADDDTIKGTVAQLVADLGVGGQALQNPDRAMSFMEDISAAVTQAEMVGAVLGDPSRDFLIIADQIRENEYPEYDDALPNEQSIGSFFRNVGYLIPAQLRSEMQETLRAVPDGDEMPANPTLCATPEALEEFKNLRCQLLEGRATPEQCDEMFEKWRGTMLDDLGEMSDIAQKGIGNIVADQLPPMFSDPGCDNGMLPYEPEQNVAAATTVLKGDMEKLKVAFSSDMLDNGPGAEKWGFINMVMADTIGNPFTAHQRKTFNKKDYVDFYMDPTPPGSGLFEGGADPEDWLGLSLGTLGSQKGAYPIHMAGYLMYQFQYAGRDYETPDLMATEYEVSDLGDSLTFESSNKYQPDSVYTRTFERLDIDASGFNIIQIPNQGYDTDIMPHFDPDVEGGGYITFVRNLRKDEPDVKLKFRDNAEGMRKGPNGEQSEYGYGFDIACYFSDIYRDPDDWYLTDENKWTPGPIRNRPGDNTRLYISELLNLDSRVSDDKMSLLPEDPEADARWKLGKPEEKKGVMKYRKFEFLTYDDGLDGIELENYPSLAESFERHVPQQPETLALYDLFGGSVSHANAQQAYESFMSAQFKKVAAEIGQNSMAWQYGAKYDNLSFAQFEYVVPKGMGSMFKGGSRAEGESLFSRDNEDVYVKKYDKDGVFKEWGPVVEDDAIMGVSLDQYKNEEEARVIYLDPAKYGGSYMNPPIYVKPITGSGWMGIVDLLFPEPTQCKPHNTDLVDFDEISDKIDEMYPRLASDTRLKSDPDCIVEVPFARALERPAKAGLMAVIMASIKMFASVHFLKGLGTFSTFAPKFPDNYSNVYAAYIIEKMEEQFKDANNQLFSPFVDNEFWYAFLEQSVQLYGIRIGPSGDISEEDVPQDVRDALNRLDDAQADYEYPSREDKSQDPTSSWTETVKNYRERLNLRAVFENQEDAKLILKQLVVEQLDITGEKFVNNLRSIGFNPKVTDLDYYYMTDFCAGSSLELDGKIAEKAVGLPTPEDPDPASLGWEWPGPFYSEGNEFTTTEDTKYVGYYHGHVDSLDGSILYMIGDTMATEFTGSVEEMENEEQGLLLRPFANKTIVGITSSAGFTPMGDVPDWNEGAGASEDKPFVIKKYITVNGSRQSSAEAVRSVKAKGTGNISDHFPGTMTLLYPPPSTNADPVESGQKMAGGTINKKMSENPITGEIEDRSKEPVGVVGELGVRYGLEFRMWVNGQEIVITNVEISALDVPVSSFTGVERDSKMLFCLLNKLKEDERYRLVTRYIFSLKKVLGITAIYNDMAFLPSIGEWTVGPGDANGNVAKEFPASSGAGSKPGKYAKMQIDYVELDDAEVPYVEEVNLIDGAPGWATYSGRRLDQWDNAFFQQYHEWDQETLRRSIKLMKKLFRVHYRARDWSLTNGDDVAGAWLKSLRERFKLAPGAKFLPWWKRSRLRGNPYNADGELCNKPD